MFHCNGWCTAWGVTAIGGRHVCLRAVRGDRIWQLIEQEEVTHLNGAPPVLSALVSAEEAHPLERPLVITTAGAPPNPKTIAQCEDINARVVHVYGLTETYGPYSVCQWQEGWEDLDVEERAALLSRQGVGMIQAERLRVVDDEMNDVPADGATMGEIVMRGNNVMKGYFDDEEATAEAFRDGWFHSGDLGVMHPDGYVQLLDRAKDVVISGGENISTVEIEQALRHPRQPCWRPRSSGCPTRSGASGRRRFVVLKPGKAGQRGGAHRPRQVHHCPLQGAQSCRLPGRAANDLDGQGPEVRAPGARVGRTRLQNQGVRHRRIGRGAFSCLLLSIRPLSISVEGTLVDSKRSTAARWSARESSGRKRPLRSTGSSRGTACSTTLARRFIGGSPAAG